MEGLTLELRADGANQISFAPEIGTRIKYDDGLSGTVFREAPPKMYNGTIIRTWSVELDNQKWRSLFKLEAAH